jgi:hypothetical protein
MMNNFKGLSPAQQVAMSAIAAGYVTYQFAPLKPSKTRIKKVTSADITPRFSHGLKARTVFSLERAGLIRLIASDIMSGVVLPVLCGDQDPRQDQHCVLLVGHGGEWHEARKEPGYVGDCWPTDPDLLVRYAAGEAI